MVRISSKTGGTFTIDELADPDRPGNSGAEVNPEDDGPTDKHFYGPAFRITAPEAVETSDEPRRAAYTVVFTLDGATNLVDPNELARQSSPNPLLVTDRNSGCSADSASRNAKVKTLANGDAQITYTINCGTSTWHFYNPGWGVRGGEFFGSFASSLDTVLKARALPFSLWCVLKCSSTVVLSIDPKSARKLKIKGTLATVKTAFGERFEGEAPLSAKVRKALGRAKQITIRYKATAVGPAKQVETKTGKVTLKADPDEADQIR